MTLSFMLSILEWVKLWVFILFYYHYYYYYIRKILWHFSAFLCIEHPKFFSATFQLNFIYITIIMSGCQNGSPWPSFATRLYRPSLPGGLQGYILYRHRAVIYRFLPFVLPLLVHVKGSTGVCHLWVRPVASHMSGSSNLDSFRARW